MTTQPSVYICPDCKWEEHAHPDYGWQEHNQQAVRVHLERLCPKAEPQVWVFSYDTHWDVLRCDFQMEFDFDHSTYRDSPSITDIVTYHDHVIYFYVTLEEL